MWLRCLAYNYVIGSSGVLASITGTTGQAGGAGRVRLEELREEGNPQGPWG
jgi:hypothetical protein